MHIARTKNPRARAVQAAADTSATATTASAGELLAPQLTRRVRKRRRAASSASAPTVQEDGQQSMFAVEIRFMREARARGGRVLPLADAEGVQKGRRERR
jgi:hypothetical protein